MRILRVTATLVIKTLFAPEECFIIEIIDAKTLATKYITARWNQIPECDQIRKVQTLAITVARFDILQYFPIHPNEIQDFIAIAICANQFRSLNYLYDYRVFLPSGLFAAAAAADVNMLRWLKTKQCSWNVSATYRAAGMGKRDNLIWLLRNGCPCTNSATDEAAINGHYDIVKYLTGRGLSLTVAPLITAAQYPDALPRMKVLRALGCPLDSMVFNTAAKFQDVETLSWLNEIGCPWDAYTCAAAASRLENLNYVHSLGAPLYPKTFANAAENATITGDLTVLKRLKELKTSDDIYCEYIFPPNDATDDNAAQVLEWLSANGMPMRIPCETSRDFRFTKVLSLMARLGLCDCQGWHH